MSTTLHHDHRAIGMTPDELRAIEHETTELRAAFAIVIRLARACPAGRRRRDLRRAALRCWDLAHTGPCGVVIDGDGRPGGQVDARPREISVALERHDHREVAPVTIYELRRRREERLVVVDRRSDDDEVIVLDVGNQSRRALLDAGAHTVGAARSLLDSGAVVRGLGPVRRGELEAALERYGAPSGPAALDRDTPGAP